MLARMNRRRPGAISVGGETALGFSTHNPENFIIIENRRKGVVIRAAQNNFSPRRKAFLIRQLAAEGYIPDRYEQVTEEAWDRTLVWVVDRSLLMLGREAARRTRRAMQRLIVGGCALWLLEIALLLLTHR